MNTETVARQEIGAIGAGDQDLLQCLVNFKCVREPGGGECRLVDTLMTHPLVLQGLAPWQRSGS